MSGAPRRLLLATTVLVVGAACALSFGSRTDADRRERQRKFQHAVGGLGLGPALDLREGAGAFDPRLGAGAHGGALIVNSGSAPR